MDCERRTQPIPPEHKLPVRRLPQLRAGPATCACLAIPGATPAFRRATAHSRCASVRSPRAIRALANRVRAGSCPPAEMASRLRLAVPGCWRSKGKRRLTSWQLSKARGSLVSSHILLRDARIIVKSRKWEPVITYPNVELNFQLLCFRSLDRWLQTKRDDHLRHRDRHPILVGRVPVS